mmetsp:Transcript_10889/g.30630  ORF Transcript_10889/g.30630 Transcript_10889/m.30630 type:complete len:211 (+) Transcript_10889:2691-3323(+)
MLTEQLAAFCVHINAGAPDRLQPGCQLPGLLVSGGNNAKEALDVVARAGGGRALLARSKYRGQVRLQVLLEEPLHQLVRQLFGVREDLVDHDPLFLHGFQAVLVPPTQNVRELLHCLVPVRAPLQNSRHLVPQDLWIGLQEDWQGRQVVGDQPPSPLEQKQAARAFSHPWEILVPQVLIEGHDKPTLQLVAVHLDPLHYGGQLVPDHRLW